MPNRFLYILAAAALLFSCTKEESGAVLPNVQEDAVYEQSSIPVGFGVADGWTNGTKTTKATEDPSKIEFEYQDQFGVSAFYRANGTNSIGSLTPNFMFNQIVTYYKWDDTGSYNADYWHYSPVKYWPNNPNDRVDFYAYYPWGTSFMHASKSGLVTSPDTKPGVPSLEYNMRYSKASGKTDFLYATALDCSKPATNANVTFNFKHLMGKLQFKVKTSADTIFLKSVMFDVNTHGIFNYTENGGYPVWSVSADSTYSLQQHVGGRGAAVLNNAEGTEVHDFTLFLLPVAIKEMTLVLSIDRHNYTEIKLENLDIDVEAGKVTTVNMQINTTDISITAQTQPWKDIQVGNGDIVITPQ